MRITIVEFSPAGGLFQFAFQLGEGLVLQGHRVEMLTGPDPELTSTTGGLEVRPMLPTWHPGSTGLDHQLLHRLRRGVRAFRHVAALLRVLAHLVRHRPDVVFWHELRFPMDCWTVSLVARLLPGLNTVVLHEPRPLAEQPGATGLYRTSPLLTRALAGALTRMDVIFVLSQKVRGYVEETWQPAPGSVVVIPHGDESVFLPGTAVTPVADTPPKALFFGTWTTYKGIDALVGAFARVRKAMPEAELTMAGAVGNVDFSSIEARTRRIGGVTLKPGYVPMPEVADLLGSHRVVVVPYVRANQSGVAHLAHTFGRPVVATQVGDLPDVVVEGKTGWLVEPGDEEALAEAIVAALSDPDEAARRGSLGMSSLSTRGSWKQIGQTVAETLEGLR